MQGTVAQGRADASALTVAKAATVRKAIDALDASCIHRGIFSRASIGQTVFELHEALSNYLGAIAGAYHGQPT